MAKKVLVEDSSKQSKMAKKVFLLSGFSPREKEEIHRKILQLGGHSKIAEDIYVTECTYVIVPNSWKDKWTTIVMGAIGSGKFIVREDFIHKSFEAKKFLREDEFIPTDIVILRSAFNKHGKIFLNQNCIILMENSKKQIELRNMVRDSGGTVLNWSCKDLALKRDVELMRVDFIYTDLSDHVLKDDDYNTFIKKRMTMGKPVLVKSYFLIFKLLTTLARDKDRKFFENVFDVSNHILMDKLHPIDSRRSKTETSTKSAPSVRRIDPKEIIVIEDSSDESDDDDIQMIESGPVPIPIKNVETIDLISSDEEDQIKEKEKEISESESARPNSGKMIVEESCSSRKYEVAVAEAEAVIPDEKGEKMIIPEETNQEINVTKSSKDDTEANDNASSDANLESFDSQTQIPQVQPNDVQHDMNEELPPPKKPRFVNIGSLKPKADDQQKSKFFNVGNLKNTSSKNALIVQPDVHSQPYVNDGQSEPMETQPNEANETDKNLEALEGVPSKSQEQDIAITENNNENLKSFGKKFCEIDEEVVTKCILDFRRYQKEACQGLDLSDRRIKTPFYDQYLETPLGDKFLNEKKEPLVEEFKRMDVILANDNEEEDDYDFKMNLMFLETMKTIISSRHYIPASILSKYLERLDAPEKPKYLLFVMTNTFIEILHEQFSYYPPSSGSRRHYYSKLFGGNLVKFIKQTINRYLSYDSTNKLHFGMIEFCIKILEMDLTYWWKHNKSKSNLPLIAAFDFENALYIADTIKSTKNDAPFQDFMLNLFTIVCNYFSYKEKDRDRSSLWRENSTKSKLAKAVSGYNSEDHSLKTIIAKTYLLRPSWLAFQVQTNLLKTDRFLLCGERNNLDPKAYTMLEKFIPKSIPVEDIPTIDTSFALSLIGKIIEVVPMRPISRLILEMEGCHISSKYYSKDNVKLSKSNKDESKDKMRNVVVFDNGIGVEQTVLKSCLEICTELMGTNEQLPLMWQLR